jgi:thiol-disulfide isomerase/thioredoxin
VPDLRFVDAAGRQRSLAEFRGRAVLLNLWAPWCEPCRAELDSLDGLEARLGGPDFEVVALSLDPNGPEGVQRFYARHAVRTLGVYVDPNGAALRALKTRGIPTTLLLDKEGREVGRTLGAATWDEPAVVREIERRLGREPQPAPAAGAD